ncbi:TIGR01244 family sulfur transferase [Gynuella sunshinyii]|uniref:Beta-lactamase hydrolase-like protein phosphatase-like domain-containing protein n=1 Tax=Gynuella sunshinyii YC6258 TaxID=1445510 RepID=A0A0C5VP36_9GAMM|nr:TIGR01244 family sulfur transferase [Gynuella sunshinyii]AJQ96422.1 hypothetical protein YC6258_04390 [Gynuella sunshinyii YC6258]
MELKYLTDTFAVTGQITVADVTQLSAADFTAVVCNRPDAEEPGQPLSADIAMACENAGLDFLYIPMNGPNYSAADVSRLKEVLSANKGKVLGFCRTGNRSSILWNAAQG